MESFQQLQLFVGGSLKKEGKNTKLVVSSRQSIQPLREYFTLFALYGCKKIAQNRWMSFFLFRDEKRLLPPLESLKYRKMRRFLSSVNRCKNLY